VHTFPVLRERVRVYVRIRTSARCAKDGDGLISSRGCGSCHLFVLDESPMTFIARAYYTVVVVVVELITVSAGTLCAPIESILR